jgi:hypothetical protein
VTSTDWNRAIISSYGRRDVQLSTRPPAPARAFNDVVDIYAVNEIVEKIGEMKRKKIDSEVPLNKLREKNDAFRKQCNELQDEIVSSEVS